MLAGPGDAVFPISSKVAFVISQLQGRALQWAESIWTQGGPVTQSLSSFLAHFREVFGRPEGDTSVSERLYQLKQGQRSIQDYALEFRTLAAASGWNEQSLITTFRQGLEPGIRLHLASYKDTIGLERFIQLVPRVDTRMQACLAEHQDQQPYTPSLRQPENCRFPEPDQEPMQLDSRLSPAERQRRLTRGSCLYCGAAGHNISSCPVRPLRTMVSAISPHRPWDCAIDLIPGEPVPHGKIYPLSLPEQKAMGECIKEALAQGYIRPSTSPAASSFFFVAKKDGGLQPCVDYRGLNRITVKFQYPLPLVPAALEQLRGATVYTKLDLRSAYNLIRIREGDGWKTAFVTPTGHYEYLVMPYGMVNAPSVFQDFIHEGLRECLHKFVIVYIDDILIYSRSMAEHRQHVAEVLECLRDHQLFLKAEKCVPSVLSAVPRLQHQ
ncbi:uncharacterized protein LOC122875938 [Siniperca chuatsi]|uniref:uncharacterized protein LOC122875938 n=1 Tax=Siniperca chuatsi TaxID=119488 RepID=UPI001CE09332|nr:uncharacterized protein LOC122875938 [Siniperca chuatsi]XP_044051576.1 uncharacterized protein LOC122875938 [Siniperca chuatsi]XP_044051577.1 uncharacterized protein LOC122875938 [Siniperca chuatsi]XP_044051578.1 uncharacterized protein LOC122875938 [Siniperca chuatsi]XP_044051579.1 uncharacterized protein LOC122875938 [Siniperca chuatsi]